MQTPVRLHLLALFLVISTPACGPRTSAPADSRVAASPQVFEALEGRLRDAMIRPDTAALAALWAPEYLSTSAVGHTSTRGEALMAYASGLVRVDSADIADLDIRVYDRAAVVLGRLTWGGQAAGGPFASTARFQHVWVERRSGDWQLVASQLTGQPSRAGR